MVNIKENEAEYLISKLYAELEELRGIERDLNKGKVKAQYRADKKVKELEEEIIELNYQLKKVTQNETKLKLIISDLDGKYETLLQDKSSNYNSELEELKKKYSELEGKYALATEMNKIALESNKKVGRPEGSTKKK